MGSSLTEQLWALGKAIKMDQASFIKTGIYPLLLLDANAELLELTRLMQ